MLSTTKEIMRFVKGSIHSIMNLDKFTLYIFLIIFSGCIATMVALIISNYKRKKNVRLYEDSAILQNRNIELKKEIGLLIKKKEEYKQAYNEVNSKSEKLLNEFKSLSLKKNKLTKDINKSTEELKSLEDRISNNQKIIDEQNKTIGNNRIEISQTLEELDKLISNIEFIDGEPQYNIVNEYAEEKVADSIIWETTEEEYPVKTQITNNTSIVVLDIPEPLKNEPVSLKRIGYTPIVICPEEYPAVYMPKDKSVIKFPRKGRYGTKGISEHKFKTYLEKYFASNNIKLYDDRLLVISENTPPYEPDFSLIDEKTDNLNMFIDIEIDEPYDGVTREPLHYIGLDSLRNRFFAKRGWIVIRFSELQIVENPIGCCKFIADTIRSINQNFQVNDELKQAIPLSKDQFWSKEKAQELERSNYREEYLKMTFNRAGSSAAIKLVIAGQQNENELEAEKKVQDDKTDDIHYGVEKQQALDDTNEIITIPVNDVICQFYSQKQIKTDYREYTVLRGQLINDIDNYFGKKNRPKADNILFKQFQSFFNDIFEKTHIYKRDWKIYDEITKISGVVNLVSHNGDGTYTIYNWIVIKDVERKFDFSKGITKWKTEAEFNYIHATLEMNICKAILDKNYKIPVTKMFMVQFHPNIKEFSYVLIDVLYNTTKILFAISKELEPLPF